MQIRPYGYATPNSPTPVNRLIDGSGDAHHSKIEFVVHLDGVWCLIGPADSPESDV